MKMSYKHLLRLKERIKNGEASNLEEFFRGTGFSFGNTKNKKLWSDPATGQLLLVEMEPDPDKLLPDKYLQSKQVEASPE